LTSLAEILEQHPTERLFTDAALSGLQGQEAAFAEMLMQRPAWREKNNEKFLANLAHAASLDRNPASLYKILELASNDTSERGEALLDGILDQPIGSKKAKNVAKPKLIHLQAEPPALAKLRTQTNLAEKISALEAILMWPGKAGVQEATVRPLTPAEKEQFVLGKETYTLTCAACHQPHGLGQEGLAPPLVDSEWVNGPASRIARIVLGGLRGPVHVKGKAYTLEMPPLGILEDQQIAAILTYIRREWNHTADPVTVDFIKKTREEIAGRDEPWNEADLQKVK
jgi:mono/diheme cytochrome c family protein